MLETPRMKLVKLNYEHMNTNPGMLQEFYNEFLEKTAKAIVETENKFIQEFAEEECLSLECAEYLIHKHYRFHIETITPDSMMGTPKLNLVLKPKPIEEILNDNDIDTSRDKECEKELLKRKLRE